MSAPSRGRLVALEGIDGCGKSTQAGRLASSLGALLTAEPGATELGRRLRAILLDPGGPPCTPTAESLLMVADRAQHVHEVIEPALAAGRWVVSDRFSGSTLAYQGYGRGLDPGALAALLAFATGGTEASLSVLIDVPAATARSRVADGPSDRMERLGASFHQRVRDGYLKLAADDPGHWAVVDGSADEETVAGGVRRAVAARLGAPADPAR